MNLRRSRSQLIALAAVAASPAALPATQADATVVGTPTHAPGSYYVLKNAKARCRAHYTRETVTVRSRRHGKVVKTRQLRCVYGVAGSGSKGSGSGSGAGAGPGFPVDLPTGTVTVTVLPTAADHSYTTTAGTAIDVGGDGVLANATGTGLSASLVSGPASGSLTLNKNGSFEYTPASGASGIVHFVYRANSSDGESSTPAKVTIAVTPLAVDSVFAVSADQTLTIPAGGLLAGDVGSGLTADLVSRPADGSLTLNPDGSATYTPASTFSGTDSFSYQAVDGAALHSNTATVTVNVGDQPPSVVSEIFSGAITNTELQIGGAGGTGPEVYDGTTSALAGDTDPNGGTLSVTPGTITTAQGGTVTMAGNGDFTYQPPAGFTGPSDSFNYTVDESEGLSAPASATIDLDSQGQRVWYVNDTAAAGGTGTSAAPFNSLAATGAAVGDGDVIFVESSSTPYAGGITLEPGVDLVGSGAALVVDGVTLLNPAGSPPVITNASGAGITLAEGDHVSGLTVNGTSGDAIAASGVNSFTLDQTVSVTGAGGDGLDVSGGSGTIADAAQISGSAGHSLAIANRGGGTVTVSGAIQDAGDGVLVSDDGGATVNFTGDITASTGSHEAFLATGGGTVTATSASSTLATTTARALEVSNGSAIGALGLTFQSVVASSSPDYGILLDAPASMGGVRVTGNGGTAASGGTIADATATGVGGGAVSIDGVPSVHLTDMDIVDPAGDGVYAVNAPGLTLDAVTITGTNTGTGDGLSLSSSSGTLDAVVTGSTIQGIANGSAINAQSLGTGELDLTLSNNVQLSTASTSAPAVTVTSNAGRVCLDAAGNTMTAGGSHAMEVDQAGGVFGINGYSGAAANLVGVQTFLSGANGSASTLALDPGGVGFTDCTLGAGT